MDKLLPCPFCGGEAIQDTITMACCKECFASSTATKWNTRHTPEGWRLVPDQPTGDMIEDGRGLFNVGDTYEAMLAAAPKWGGG